VKAKKTCRVFAEIQHLSRKYPDRLALWAASRLGSRSERTKEHFLTGIKEKHMFKPKLEKLLKDSYYYKNLPVYIRIPALGAVQETITKPIVESTLDELEFAAQALDKEADAITTRLYAIRRLYREAREKGALGSENILDALSRKGGAE
jgi:hypothetical protein